jgi:hypothetical protein
VTYRDAATALFGGGFEKAFAATQARLYSDKAKFEEEARGRFSCLRTIGHHRDACCTLIV